MKDDKYLIELGNLERSKDPFVREVSRVLENLDEEVKRIFENKLTLEQITECKDFELKRMLRLAGKTASSHGFMTSSLDDNKEKEILWSAIVADITRKTGFDPIIIPIDKFYLYLPEKMELVSKLFYFKDSYNERGQKRFIILSGITQSSLYEEDVLKSIPYQANAGLSTPCDKTTETGRKFSEFGNELEGLLIKYDGNIDEVIKEVSEKDKIKDGKTSVKAAKILIATELLGYQTNWQKLWQERLAPAYFIAPQSFHFGLTRISYTDAHNSKDYIIRVGLESYIFPPFDIQKEKIITHNDAFKNFKESMNTRQKDIFTEGGLSREEFTALIDRFH